MTDAEVCKLCKGNRATEIDLEKPHFKSVNKLLQRLFDWYKIDVAILGENSCICELCFEDALRISESLEKWSMAQEEIRDKPIEIDDSTAFQVKLEFPAYEEEVESVEKDEKSTNQYIAEPEKEDNDLSGKKEHMEFDVQEPLKPPSEDFFSVGLARDGLAVTKFFKDKTQATRMLCTCCGQVLEILAHIRMHCAKPRPNPVYYCRECGSKFSKLCELQEHMKTMGHLKTKCGGRDLEFLCLRCNQIFPRYFDVIRHDNSAHRLSEYMCVECNVSFVYQGSYEKHLRNHGVEQQVYECPYKDCVSRFRVWTRLVSHMRWHKGRSSQCPFPGCNSKLPSWNYHTHMRSHSQQGRLNREGKFMILDPMKRVEPDRRKVPYGKRHLVFTEAQTLCSSNGGEFISLPKELSLQQGKYINVGDNQSA
ncbi:zinc finger protein 774 [Drosophila teissieri]|uniref:zinc finger protein 774 n=1 Tax=Drosophila teissieri TaxID=7243 RepID=UPI001CBA2F76|nr:zinc finger protein 774 [Drosophila teissieri]